MTIRRAPEKGPPGEKLYITNGQCYLPRTSTQKQTFLFAQYVIRRADGRAGTGVHEDWVNYCPLHECVRCQRLGSSNDVCIRYYFWSYLHDTGRRASEQQLMLCGRCNGYFNNDLKRSRSVARLIGSYGKSRG